MFWFKTSDGAFVNLERVISVVPTKTDRVVIGFGTHHSDAVLDGIDAQSLVIALTILMERQK